ncbi:hypothetical protein K7432_013574 [Basidiobolus ranarum]|uniref:Uncharacterized protein n=1 Tax=Basidiobolus ranarum TaxID=34480 RepID=A0ABR2WJ19_9FUNG
MNFESTKPSSKHKNGLKTRTLTRCESDGASHLAKHFSPASLCYSIQGDPLRHEMMVQSQGQPVYYLRTTSKLFGRELALYNSSNDTPIYRISSHKTLGYMKISSSASPTQKTRFPYPHSSHGMYAMESEGIQFVWDYSKDKYLRCYDMTDMSIVAELFWKDPSSNRSSCSSFCTESMEDIHYAKYMSKLMISSEWHANPTQQMFIVLTGLLILRNSIWKRDV